MLHFPFYMHMSGFPLWAHVSCRADCFRSPDSHNTTCVGILADGQSEHASYIHIYTESVERKPFASTKMVEKTLPAVARSPHATLDTAPPGDFKQPLAGPKLCTTSPTDFEWLFCLFPRVPNLKLSKSDPPTHLKP